MPWIKICLCLGFLFFAGYTVFNGQNQNRAVQKVNLKEFVPVPEAQGAKPGEVMIIAALNCTREAARNADQLAADLTAKNIPHARKNNISFIPPAPGPEQEQIIANMQQVMTQEPPIVLVNGKAKANPSLAEVLEQL
jgi:hypothetical protein